MRKIEFSDGELELLREILDNSLEISDIEVHRTDSITFKEKLKHRRDMIERLLTKVGQPTAFAT